MSPKVPSFLSQIPCFRRNEEYRSLMHSCNVTGEGTAKVLLINCLGIFQRAQKGLEVGSVRLMQKVLSGQIPDGAPEFVEVYIDDVLIFSRTMEEHLNHLRQILEGLKKAGLKFKLSKCHFIRQTVEYLGHVITLQGLLPKPKQVSAVKDFPVPESVTQFLSLTSYYQRFIQQFSKIAFPLHNPTRKDVDFVWTEECQTAFRTLKEKLIEAPVLVYPDFHRIFCAPDRRQCEGSGSRPFSTTD